MARREAPTTDLLPYRRPNRRMHADESPGTAISDCTKRTIYRVRPFRLVFQYIPRRCAEKFFVGSYSNDAFQSLLFAWIFPEIFADEPIEI